MSASAWNKMASRLFTVQMNVPALGLQRWLTNRVKLPISVGSTERSGPLEVCLSSNMYLLFTRFFPLFLNSSSGKAKPVTSPMKAPSGTKTLVKIPAPLKVLTKRSSNLSLQSRRSWEARFWHFRPEAQLRSHSRDFLRFEHSSPQWSRHLWCCDGLGIHDGVPWGKSSGQ